MGHINEIWKVVRSLRTSIRKPRVAHTISYAASVSRITLQNLAMRPVTSMLNITNGNRSSQMISTIGHSRNSGIQTANHRNLIHITIGGITGVAP